MTYDARQIANWLVNRTKEDGRRISVMSLLKLIYIAHGWNLALHDTALIYNRIEAWKYGPVIPDVYNAFRPQGVYPDKDVDGYPPELDHMSEDLMGQIYKIYGCMNSYQLSSLTHVRGGPWETATRLGGHYALIPDDLIKSHYKEKLKSSERANE